MKTLVILAHPKINESKANKRWKDELFKYPQEIKVHELYIEYPNWNIDVQKEQNLLMQYEHIILQFPLFWFNCPPLLKKWLDEVFEYNWAYGPQGNKLKGKKIWLAVTAGGKMEYYRHGGKNKFSLDEIFIPFEETVNYAQGIYLPYFSVYGVSSHINELNDDKLSKNARDYIEHIRRTRE